ncbi:hypothetical protein PR202_gb01895 [Eleusine coracana subsp. coracana]|uniref:Uncharacterized protein n=1 Tax=Eleusine coracana subsp. coracana TaxID=191504 RepID=A0AAV5DYP1_ELECO|nr:hypothetical protein PR202_gb01895 [Eleusine coracana subsp. coracana]
MLFSSLLGYKNSDEIFVLYNLLEWSWNSAAVDNNLWRMNYSLFFGACNVNGISIPVAKYILHAEDLAASSSDIDDANNDSDDEHEHRRFWLL